MMGVGLVVGLITVLLSDFVFIKIHDRGIWNEEKDVNHSSNVVTELLESPMPVAAMTEEKLPPAPVISSTTPALFRASPADFSKFSRPMNRMLTR